MQTTSSFVQPPSAVDIQNASPSPTINIVVGTGNKTVYVYTGAGCTYHESLKEFNKPQCPYGKNRSGVQLSCYARARRSCTRK